MEREIAEQIPEAIKAAHSADPGETADTKENDTGSGEAIAKIAVETKGFTVISKADCEALIIKMTELMGGN